MIEQILQKHERDKESVLIKISIDGGDGFLKYYITFKYPLKLNIEHVLLNFNVILVYRCWLLYTETASNKLSP